jgi:V/A-type H+-transporting ATPase subunit K
MAVDPAIVGSGSAMGLALGLLGAGLSFALGGAGSSVGVALAGMMASGVITEDPKKFGKMILLILIPGTQGIYGLLIFFFISFVKLGMLTNPIYPTMTQGYQLLFIGGCSGFVQFLSAIYQGKVSAAAIGIVAKKPEEAGKALILPAFVETYAVFALVAAFLIIYKMNIG